MSVQYFAGFETGDLSEIAASGGSSVTVVSSPTISGGYCLKVNSFGINTYAQSKGGLNLSTSYTRMRINAHVTGNPSSQMDFTLVSLDYASGQIAKVAMIITTGGVIQLYCYNTVGAVLSGPATTTISADTTYLLETKLVVSASVGILEWKIDGVVIGTLANTNTGTNNLDTTYHAMNLSTGNAYCLFDDIVIDNANYPGPGRCIKVQGTAGTPNVDAFTKTGAATAALCWSTTPYATAANCNSSTSGAGQTMLCAASGLMTQQILACKAAMIAKTAVASSHSIRRRLASTNTDLAKSLTTADAYYESAIFTDTIANLNTAEIGVLHGANSNLLTVEDMWLMIDYTDASLIVEPVMQAVMVSANW